MTKKQRELKKIESLTAQLIDKQWELIKGDKKKKLQAECDVIHNELMKTFKKYGWI